jgi:hypothetical protein
MTVALRIPGIEFVVQNMTGQKASANREKFLLLIEDWKKQQASVLGKRPAPAAAAAGAPKVPRIEAGGFVGNALVLRSIKTMSAVSGAVNAICSDVKDVKTGVLDVTAKVDVVKDRVKQGTTEVKKLAASVDANHRQQLQQLEVKDAQIKKLQDDKRILQDINERQRVQIAKMNKERDEMLLKAPSSSDAKLNAIADKVDTVFRALITVHDNTKIMHATSTSLLKDVRAGNAFLAAITAAIAP